MYADHFDALVRSLPAVSRRAALGGVLGAGLAALHGHFAAEDAAAKKKRRKRRKRKKRCRAGAVRCQGKCCIPGQSCENPGAGCVNGVFEPGDRCNPARPGECASGNCGCDGDDCSCRVPVCSEFRCFLDIECCQGRCVNGTICAGG